jgi:hypothetical protein
LNGDGALHRIHRAGELDQRAVPHHLDDTAAAAGDGGIEARGPDVPQPGERSRFIGPRQPRKADDIGGQDRRETALGSHIDTH